MVVFVVLNRRCLFIFEQFNFVFEFVVSKGKKTIKRMLQYCFHVCMFRRSVVRKDRLSQSQVKRKYICSLHGFKAKDARRLKAEGTRLRGAACSVFVLRFFGCSYRLSYRSYVFYTFRKPHQANWAVVRNELSQKKGTGSAKITFFQCSLPVSTRYHGSC